MKKLIAFALMVVCIAGFSIGCPKPAETTPSTTTTTETTTTETTAEGDTATTETPAEPAAE